MLALSGVACTTKSTILKRINGTHNIVSHLSDFKELHDQFDLLFDVYLGQLLYTAHRCQNDVRQVQERPESVHLFDRMPTESIVYATMDRSHDECRRVYAKYEQMDLHRDWRSVVLTAAPGSESIVVEAMKRRNNGIDQMTEEYVIKQTERFKLWAEVIKAPIVEIDWRLDIETQQKAVMAIIENMMFDRKDWTPSISTLKCRLPIINNKFLVLRSSELIKLFDSDVHSKELEKDLIRIVSTHIKEKFTVIVLIVGDKKEEDSTEQAMRLFEKFNVPMVVVMVFTENLEQNLKQHVDSYGKCKMSTESLNNIIFPQHIKIDTLHDYKFVLPNNNKINNIIIDDV
uniref:Uncharacterized protein n=1 Tax=Lymantria dispar multicapsid nuclear polyhedrosis virus TaxID=10449 RepID=A0A1B1MR01_NPVLD|nr:hypothetical protein [Lymantria dispar multiple nucleopolyhedrovirus]